MRWRVIGPEKRRGPTNLALEEACIENVGIGRSPPTVFFYEWEKPAVIIGHFQKLHDEVDVPLCEQHGVDIIRRITGGGAMYQDDKAMTFGVIAPENEMPASINSCYHEVCGKIIDALGMLGIEAEFKPINDITVAGKKISGSAMTKRKGAVMVHGTLLHTIDVEKMFTFLKVGRTKISDKGIQSVKERVTSITHHKDVSRGEVYDALARAFTEGKEFYTGQWSEGEILRAKQLIQERYINPEWIYRR